MKTIYLAVCACLVGACSSSADAERQTVAATSNYTACVDREALQRCEDYGGGHESCVKKYCSTIPDAPASCYDNTIYTKEWTTECYLNTPGSPVAGQGNYACTATFCPDEQPGSRRDCHLVDCLVGTQSGDAF